MDVTLEAELLMSVTGTGNAFYSHPFLSEILLFYFNLITNAETVMTARNVNGVDFFFLLHKADDVVSDDHSSLTLAHELRNNDGRLLSLNCNDYTSYGEHSMAHLRNLFADDG